MRVVIVEDEIKTRRGLENIIKKFTPHEVVASASDGEQGLQAVCELKPDVIITDIKMPEMDGLTMLEKIREKDNDARVLLLTGFSDFEFARKSIQLGADDYLLKPLNVEDIIESLEKIERKIDKHKNETVSGQQLLFSILNAEESKGKSYVGQLEQQLHIIGGEKISLFLIQASSRLTSTINEMISALNEILPAVYFVRYYIFRLPNSRQILLMVLDGQSVHYMKELFMMHVAPEIGKIGECMLAYGEIKQLDQLPKKLTDMTSNFEYGFGLEKCLLLDDEYIASCRFEEVEYPDQLEQMLRKEIRSGNKEKVKKLAEKFQTQIIDSNARPRYIKEYTLRFMMVAVNGARDRNNNRESADLYQLLIDGVMESDTREKMLYEYWKIWDSLDNESGEQEQTENGTILKVIELIRNNYARDLSLSEAAEYVGLTPEYLSKLFTKEMGINFSTFLGDFRISTAKRMLSEGNRKIYEVAEAVGYKDTKYFNKVFRSITGISPSEYRKTIK